MFTSRKYAGVSKPDLFCHRATLATDDAQTVLGPPTADGRNDDDDNGRKSFDYIICGGGTAGCVLASRLSEDPNVKVLVVEAGESDQKQLMSRIPAGWGNLWKTPAEWNFETVPQEHCDGRTMYQPRGKMLGGCSSINAQCYQHCSPSDYDDWEKKGAKGWAWRDLKPYFAKAENHTPNPEHCIDQSKRGKGGDWQTSYPPTNEITQAFIQAAPSIGIPSNPDLNDELNTTGVTRFQATVDAKGQRSSTSAAYLTPKVFARPNLSILTGTTCTKLLLVDVDPDAGDGNDGDDKTKCVGVELGQTASSDGPRWHAFATRDVVVSLGSFGSPQLLQCSGIGAKETLARAGVECRVELDAVGKGLRDHVLAITTFKANKGTSLQYLTNPIKTLPSLARWLYNGTGPLSTNLAEAGAFLRSEDVERDGSVVVGDPARRGEGKTETTETARVVRKGETNCSGDKSPDLEIINAPLYYVNHALTPPPVASDDYFTLASTVLRPFSRGTVEILSGSTFDKPRIDPNYFADERDVKVCLAGLHVIRKLIETSPLSSYVSDPVAPATMSRSEFLNASDEDLVEHVVKKYAETIYHPMSTCRMGSLESPSGEGSVCDETLKVRKVRRLRVCDASVFPDSVSGHPVAAVVAVAERFADMLKQEMGSLV
ncbi:hypothetical protein JCM10212_002475 [Sporobolomyces blumeae]